MCTACGCGSGNAKVGLASGASHHHHADGNHSHSHSSDDHHIHPHPPGPRVVAIERDLLARNDARAAANRYIFKAHGTFVVNLVSSPGSGKTALLVRTAGALRRRAPVCVIEGDQETTHDVERIRAVGAPGIQINTGKGCHLDAHMVAHAVELLDLEKGGVLFIENVGNLVCPASFDLGEAHKVVIISTTEGDDKPLKYPDMFAASDLMLINKIDLLPHLDFDVDQCIDYAKRVNPKIEVMLVSATTGEGMEPWLQWILDGRERVAGPMQRLTGGTG